MVVRGHIVKPIWKMLYFEPVRCEDTCIEKKTISIGNVRLTTSENLIGILMKTHKIGKNRRYRCVVTLHISDTSIGTLKRIQGIIIFSIAKCFVLIDLSPFGY